MENTEEIDLHAKYLFTHLLYSYPEDQHYLQPYPIDILELNVIRSDNFFNYLIEHIMSSKKIFGFRLKLYSKDPIFYHAHIQICGDNIIYRIRTKNDKTTQYDIIYEKQKSLTYNKKLNYNEECRWLENEFDKLCRDITEYIEDVNGVKEMEKVY